MNSPIFHNSICCIRLILYPLLIGLSDLHRISRLTRLLWRSITVRFRPMRRSHSGSGSDPSPAPGDNSSQRHSFSRTRTPSRPRSGASPSAEVPDSLSASQSLETSQTVTSETSRFRPVASATSSTSTSRAHAFNNPYNLPSQFLWYVPSADASKSGNVQWSSGAGGNSAQSQCRCDCASARPPHALGEHQCERCSRSARAVRSEVDRLAAEFNARLMCVLFAASWSAFYGAILPILFANVSL